MCQADVTRDTKFYILKASSRNSVLLTLSQKNYRGHRINYKAKYQLHKVFIKIYSWRVQKCYLAMWMTRKRNTFNVTKKKEKKPLKTREFLKTIMPEIKEAIFNRK